MRRRLGTLSIGLAAAYTGHRFLVMSGSSPTEGLSSGGDLPADKELPESKGRDDPDNVPREERMPRESKASKIAGLRRFFSQPSEGKSHVRRDRAYYEGLSRDEKRALYPCGKRYRTLDDIPTWTQTGDGDSRAKKAKLRPLPKARFSVHPDLNDKVSVWRGDITTLEIGAIVNAANSSLMGGGGVDGAIHSAAGWSLRDECDKLGGCDTGETKLTSGHRLPAKCILHTVGPMNRSERMLQSCYETSLQLVLDHKIQTVAFSCISTGVYGFPNEAAAHVALETVRQWLESDDNAEKVTRIIFCVFLEKDLHIYRRLLHHYFPLSEDPQDSAGGEDVGGREEGGGTPPPESPKGLEEGGSDGGRAASGGDGSDVPPPAPRLEHHLTAPAGSLPVSKAPPLSSREKPDKSDEKDGTKEGDTKENREVEEQPQAAPACPEAKEEPMDTSSEHGGVGGDGTEGTTSEEGPPQPLGGQQPAEAKEPNKLETEL